MSTGSEAGPDPFADPDGSRRITGRPLVALAIGALTLVAVVAFLGHRLLAGDGPERCGPDDSGLVRLGGECVGVTDGSFVLAPRLADEQARIVRQNAAIGTQRAVTVAVLDPLTPDATSALDIDEIEHQVQGAVVAQQWINADAAATNSVRIRLVLANEGGHQAHWRAVVDQLNAMQHDRAPLVAVVGMGVSVQPTLDAAKRLSDDGIPSIGAITTADDLNQGKAAGFFRVAPANRDYVEALRPWTRAYRSGLLVYDVASDDTKHPDIFTRSLRNDFNRAFKKPLGLPAVNFHGSENSQNVQANRFGGIRNKICTEKVPLVLFAGRRNDLGQFIKALEGRSCSTDTRVTVMVGGTDLGGLVDGGTLRRANISLVWSAGIDLAAWTSGAGAPPHFDRFVRAYQSAHGQESLADGEALAGWDAVTAAATAAQAVEDEPDDGSSGDTSNDTSRPLPSGLDVRGALLNTRQLGAIPGAGGELAYEERGDRSGDPLGKPIPVLQQGVPVARPAGGVYVTG